MAQWLSGMFTHKTSTNKAIPIASTAEQRSHKELSECYVTCRSPLAQGKFTYRNEDSVQNTDVVHLKMDPVCT